jgi:hypothetical protein
MTSMPGYIRVSKEAVYALLPGLDDRIVAHVEAWRDSVKPGTMVTIDEMLMNPDGSCGCPFEFGWHSSKCRGMGHGMPMEIVMAHVFPPDGSPCAIEGVEGVVTQGPLLEVGLGRAKFIKRVN